jgi:hypothetical protein
MNDYDEIRKFIEEKRTAGAFVFMPSPILSMENSFYMPVIETVELREDEVYKATGKHRIHYNGLLRLSAAAGFEWSSIDTCRTDGRTDKMYCSFRAVGGVRKADGKIYFHKAEKDIDLEIIEMELEDQYAANWAKVKSLTGNQEWKKNGHKTEESFVSAMVRRDMIQKRKNKLMLVESGAKARVIRFVLGLQSQYSDVKQVLNTQFVMIHYALNPKHPDVRKALSGSFNESQNMIYGGVKDMGQIAYNDPTSINETDDIIDVPVEEKETQNKFEAQEEDSVDGSVIDFENSSIDDQVNILKTLCEKTKTDFDFYNDKIQGGIGNSEQQWRCDFFNHLKGKMEKGS